MGLRARATLAWALIALGLASALAVLAYRISRDELLDERRERTEAQAYLNARLVRNGLRGDEPDLRAILSSLEGNAGSVSLTWHDGQWFASSIGVSPDALPRSLLDVVEDGEVGRVVADVNGAPHVVVGVPIAESSSRYFELVTLADVDRTLGALARDLVIGSVAAAVAAAMVGWYASGRVLRPLRRMADAATAIAEGDLATRLDALGDPDLQPLQTSFNTMADAVEERVARERRFTSDVSHELRGPVAALRSTVDVALRRQHDPDSLRDAVEQLDRRVDAFHELVVDLLEISRLDAGVAEMQLDAIDTRELVEASVAMTASAGVVVEIADDVPATIVVDKRRLGRSLMSLLENAAKYAGGATRIQVSARADTVAFAVEDGGPGIPVHERRHVFGRFARGERARESAVAGSGLGLALVDEHIRLHGGRVLVQDAADGGARFVIEVPRREVVG